MKKPAESTAGTTATVRLGFSTPVVAAPDELRQPVAARQIAAVARNAVNRRMIGP
jgi:hypothetical protein